MSPTAALTVLKQATESFNGNRKQHAMIADALATLSALVEAHTPKNEKPVELKPVQPGEEKPEKQ